MHIENKREEREKREEEKSRRGEKVQKCDVQEVKNKLEKHIEMGY